MELLSFDVTPEGAQVLSFDLLNRGVGPAHEESLHVKVDGRYVKSVRELIVASLGPDLATEAERRLNPIKNVVRTRFIPGGQQQLVFRIPRTPENAYWWDPLSASQAKWSVATCYCSVFHDCWYVPNKWAEPVPVEECKRDEPNEFLP